jgi:hypothetical protein
MGSIGYCSQRVIHPDAKRRSIAHDILGRFALAASMAFVALMILAL